jgi:hypothetical protein
MRSVLGVALERPEDLSSVEFAVLVNVRLLATIMTPVEERDTEDERQMVLLGQAALDSLKGTDGADEFWDPGAIRFTLAGNLASMYRRMHQPENALEILKQTVTSSEAERYPRTLASMCVSLLDNALDMKNWDLVDAFLPRSLELCRRTGQHLMLRQAIRSAAWAEYSRGDIEAAISLLANSCREIIAEQDSDLRGTRLELAVIGCILSQDGHQLGEHLITLAAELGFRRGELWFGGESQFRDVIPDWVDALPRRDVGVAEILAKLAEVEQMSLTGR